MRRASTAQGKFSTEKNSKGLEVEKNCGVGGTERRPVWLGAPTGWAVT